MAIFVSAPDSTAIVFPITHRISGGAVSEGHITYPMADWSMHATHVICDIATSAQAEVATLLSLQMTHSLNTITIWILEIY